MTSGSMSLTLKISSDTFLMKHQQNPSPELISNFRLKHPAKPTQNVTPINDTRTQVQLAECEVRYILFKIQVINFECHSIAGRPMISAQNYQYNISQKQSSIYLLFLSISKIMCI